MKNNRKGWIVVLAGTGINLAFGVLYAWSIFGAALQEAPYSWTAKQAAMPYTVAIIMFALVMIPAGRLQDKIGPRWVATIGGVLIGIGCILAGTFTNFFGLVFSFGVLAGSGIGLGYASTTPAAVKWFPSEKKGLITGIVVGGFGLASIYIAPLSKYLLHEYGIFSSFRILGIIFLLITLPLSQLIRNPESSTVNKTNAKSSVDLTVKEMMRTKEFYQLWFMFFAGATGGLMVIGHLKSIALPILGADAGFTLIALGAIANALGRPMAGVISDRLGRGKTMMVLYILQGSMLLLFSTFNSFFTVLMGVGVIYFAYGSMLSVFPSACGDNYGTKNLGLNYGVLFSAWGFGGIFGPMLGGFIKDATGSYTMAFYSAAVFLAVATFIGFIYKPYEHKVQ
ncbi:MAG: OFA family MFS transporter [Bacillota bacterium]|nr:OFA family MFS transporter [Bacillota bacterium]